jgi:beta-lactamase regulating signal transducer with metallopeptidase domain
MTDLIAAVVRANLIGALAVLAVIAARPFFRRWFGAETAYALWLAPPLAVAAGFLPPRITFALPSVVRAAEANHSSLPLWVDALFLAGWLGGAALLALSFLKAHRAFLREVARGGPEAAVVGFINPRILMPADDGRFTADERELMRAHEREHIARGDHVANAWIAAMQCLAWFNPLAHLGAHMAKLDQELACDAAILRRNRRARGLYARTLLKAQLAGQRPALVSAWAAGGKHPLEVRVGALTRLGLDDAATGPLLVGAMVVTLAGLAWYFQPPELKAQPRLVRVTIGEPTMSVLLIRDHEGAYRPHKH